MYCSKCGTWAPETENLCGRCGAALQVENVPRPAGVAAASMPLVYCGFWRRFGSAVVDFAVVTPFTTAIEIVLGRRPFDPLEWDASWWGVQSLLMALSWFYSALMESSRWQGTLGQQLLDIRVADGAGRRISFARATGRHFAQLLSVFTLGFGYVMIAFTRRKQALHDIVSGCVLVRRSGQGPSAVAAAPPMMATPAMPPAAPPAAAMPPATPPPAEPGP